MYSVVHWDFRKNVSVFDAKCLGKSVSRIIQKEKLLEIFFSFIFFFISWGIFPSYQLPGDPLRIPRRRMSNKKYVRDSGERMSCKARKLKEEERSFWNSCSFLGVCRRLQSHSHRSQEIRSWSWTTKLSLIALHHVFEGVEIDVYGLEVLNVIEIVRLGG